MTTYAAVLTGKGVGAIATIQVYGPQAFSVISNCCKPTSGSALQPSIGQMRLAYLYDADELIDQVLVACEDQDLWAIHCHGNPLILRSAMEFLQRSGIEPVSPRALLARYYMAKGNDTIQLEARLALLDAKTATAARLLLKQLYGGLHTQVHAWRGMPLGQIKAHACQVLANWPAVRRLLNGCKVAIAGPANAGKSSIFNALLGQQRAVVSEQPGTTRDPVRDSCLIGPLAVELVDTAALCQMPSDPLLAAAQDLTYQVLPTADIVILVLDGTRDLSQLQALPDGILDPDRLITAINKADLPVVSGPGSLPRWLGQPIMTSTMTDQGIDTLRQAILDHTGVSRVNPDAPAVFTDRQWRILSQLVDVVGDDRRQADQILTQLSSGPLDF